MDAIDALFTRRSIRAYNDKEISQEDIETILRAAMSAPSAGGGNVCHYIVVRDRDLLKEVLKYHQYAHMLLQANAAIVVVSDPSLEKYPGRWPLNSSASTENMLIAATALGIGSCWVGFYPVEERMNGLRKIFNISDNLIPFAIVSLGYPAEHKKPHGELDSSIIHYNKW